MDTQKEAYRVEAYELLAELETSLLELEQAPADIELVDRVFRAMHTIKGSGAMFGFDAIAAFTHDVESVYDRVREGRIPVTTDLVDLSLRARDHIKSMLDNDHDPAAIAPHEGATLLAGFRALLTSDQAPLNADAAKKIVTDIDPPMNPPAADAGIYRIRFSPHETLFQDGTNPLALLAELGELGDCRIIGHCDRLGPLETFDPEACYLHWDILLATVKSLDAIRDVFIFAEDACTLAIELIDINLDAAPPAQLNRLGEILVARGDLDPDTISNALSQQKRIGQILVASKAVSSGTVDAALAEQAFVQEARRRREQHTSATSVRVAADKLDALVNLVGELVTVQARLSQKAQADRDPDLIAITEVVERLTGELRDNILSVRMLPIEVAFNKLRRLVRDLSADLGKSMTLRTEGDDTELDKTVIEQLNDPLVHILRNCIDHGIETPAQRLAGGKPEQGTIHIHAEHSGASVLIHISDDGAGIDPAHIRKKAIKKGLLAADAEKSDKELLQMIFLPGFSTAGAVTSVSGRGVGMDVVKRALERLQGSIEISSRPGKGTKITLKLPLTLAIIDGLLVSLGGDKYVLPLAAIEACVELTRQDVARTHGRNMLDIRGQIVPYVPLRQRFGVQGAPPDIEQVVINRVDGRRVGIVVDRVIGEHQIVIKTMNALYKDIQEISGATILGDGTVALILDVQKLLQQMDQDNDLAA